jgi:ABC-type transporter MlaC component
VLLSYTAPQRGDDTGSTTGSLRPLDLVKFSVSRVLAIAQSPPVGITGSEDRRTGVRCVAHDFFAFNEMARRVMGQHSKDCLPQEQDEFVRLFAALFTQAYVTTAERYSGENVAYLGEEITGAFAQVRSLVITTHGSRIAIEYQLLARGSRWAVYDIVLDGASLGIDISESVHVEHSDVLVHPAHEKDADGTVDAAGPCRGHEFQGQRA